MVETNGFVFRSEISPLNVIFILFIEVSIIWPPNFPNFSDRSKNGLSFGASSKLIKMMGDKIQAKKIAKENGLPVIEGSEGGVNNISKAKELSKKIG